METRQIKIKQKTFDSFFWQALSKAFWKSKQIISTASPLASILLTLWKDLNRSRSYTFCNEILWFVFFYSLIYMKSSKFLHVTFCDSFYFSYYIKKWMTLFFYLLRIYKLSILKKQIIGTPLWSHRVTRSSSSFITKIYQWYLLLKMNNAAVVSFIIFSAVNFSYITVSSMLMSSSVLD